MGQQRGLLLVLIGLGMSIMGCNGYEATYGNLSVGSKSSGLGGVTGSVINMDALNKDLDEVELAVSDVELELGKINISMLSAGETTGVAQKSVESKLSEMFDQLLLAAEKTFSRVHSLRNEVADKLAARNPNDPVDALVIGKLNEALVYLDKLEANLGDTYRGVIGKIEGLVTSIDGQIAKMDSSSPVTWAILIYWQRIKIVTLDYRDKLIALAP